MKLSPDKFRALEFKGQLVRDSLGLAAGLPWFEVALKLQPRNVSVLGEFAALLGDLGRAKGMLVVTRRMFEVDPGNSRAFFLQAVLAARAGKTEFARGLLARADDKLDAVPAAQLLECARKIPCSPPRRCRRLAPFSPAMRACCWRICAPTAATAMSNCLPSSRSPSCATVMPRRPRRPLDKPMPYSAVARSRPRLGP